MLKKILLPTVVISGTLVAGFTTFLFMQGSKPIQIQLENQQVFDGKIEDIVSPQLGALLTIGVTVTTASLLAWRESFLESEKLEKRLSQLKTEISYKDAQIEELKVAPASPMRSSLDSFLEPEHVTSSQPKINKIHEAELDETVKETVKEITVPEPVLQPVLSMRPATKPMTRVSSVSYQVITAKPSVQTAASAFSSAQSVLGLIKPYGQEQTVKGQASVK